MSRNAACASFVRASLAVVLGSAAMVLWSTAALAAEDKKDDTKQDDDQELAAVQVTGTRIQSPNVTAANPVTSISAEEMRRLGMVNVSDVLTQLVPQNISTYMPTLTGDNQQGRGGGGMEGLDRGSFFIGNTIANLRGLDPTFGTRTLTLIDGRRTVSTSNQADVVDLNTIPSNLLERVDVVTGGASATYGSGAVAGVVNLVLNRRLTGLNLDMDYGVTAAGDGASPHIALSGGTPLFGGKGHILLGGEWQDQHAIRDCAAARDWCAQSRTMFSNTTGATTDPAALLTPLPGFDGLPAHFEMSNVRYSQFAPTGTIYYGDAAVTTDYRFTPDGTDATQYALGYRGGLGTSTINGDGPLATSGTPLEPSNNRKSVFSNFEYDITPSTTAYLQGSYATTYAVNHNTYTQGNYCTRFDTTGTRGTNALAGQTLIFSTATTNGAIAIDTGLPYGAARDSRFGTSAVGNAFAVFLGLVPASAPATTQFSTAYAGNGFSSAAQVASGTAGAAVKGMAFPFYVPVVTSPNGPPAFNFNNNAVGHWVKIKWGTFAPPEGSTGLYSATYPQNQFWVLDSITLINAFDSGTSTVLPQTGRNSYAFLNNLSAAALYQVQNAFGNSTTVGGDASLYGATPCAGYTAIRKVWNPQLAQVTDQKSSTWSTVAGVRGRFGSDWHWESYYQYGSTDSKSTQSNVATNLRLGFAMDAVIDDRKTVAINGQTYSNLTTDVLPDGSHGTYGTPICRITRDGAPVLDTTGRPLSTPQGLASLAAGCKPINVFGNVYTDSQSITSPFLNNYTATYDAAQLQQQAIDYAFVDTASSGGTTLQTLSFTTSGTLWQGWAGPLSGAFTLDLNDNEVDNAGTAGDYYLRSDLNRTWADAFGGKTRTAEGSIEMNMPIITGVDGLNTLSVDAAFREGFYNQKGGAGTTGQTANQKTPNWKFQAEFEPFDWVRFRVTRSEDLRAPGYRDLFLYQPGLPDQLTVTNPWRERTATSTENQTERYGQVQVGNPDLKPEKSNTLTLGLVLRPGGWAQGMTFTADYFNIRVKDGINVPFNANNPVNACWTESGNIAPTYGPDGELVDPGVNGKFDPNNYFCQQLTFSPLLDASGNPVAGSRDLSDITAYTSARPQNGLPYQRRGIDFSLNYNFPLNRAFENLPGSLALTARGSRALESSGVSQFATFGSAAATDPCALKYEQADPQNYTLNNDGSQGTFRVLNVYRCLNLVGQIRSNLFIPGVAATPKWTGNVTASYLYGNLTTTLNARYVGGANFDNTWIDDPSQPGYYTADGRLTNSTVDNNHVDPYLLFSLNGSYDLKVANLKQFQVFGSINNLFNKDPPFTGGGIGGANAGTNDTLGRAYRMGVRLRF